MSESLIFEKSTKNRQGYSLPPLDVDPVDLENILPASALRREEARLPEVSEPDVMRHFIRLSSMNHHVDKGFYPLGSCTMKYNPKINEDLCRLPGWTQCHPMQSPENVQGALKLMESLGRYLCEISGMDAITLQPAAGAHGEMTGIKMIRAFHEKNGNPRKIILLPDSAHGTNPASATISGYETVQIKSGPDGLVDIENLKEHINEDVAGLMLTNPNTLGLFESNILEIARLIHNAGALMYMDGANLNALLGLVRPGDIGFDVLHINLHKTFSTPHGGGGPGSGPVAVNKKLADFLPVPLLVNKNDSIFLDYHRPDSIGKISSYFGNFGVMVRAYVYIRMLGANGICNVSKNAIINANYLMHKLEPLFDLPFKSHAMHEFVLSGDRQKAKGISTLEMAKKLLDYGMHAPTIYFPLIIHEAMMVEPTETESIETLDRFVEVMTEIAEMVENQPESFENVPEKTPISRLNESEAARNLNVHCCQFL